MQRNISNVEGSIRERIRINKRISEQANNE
jgi:hypothetical protein